MKGIVILVCELIVLGDRIVGYATTRSTACVMARRAFGLRLLASGLEVPEGKELKSS